MSHTLTAQRRMTAANGKAAAANDGGLNTIERSSWRSVSELQLGRRGKLKPRERSIEKLKLPYLVEKERG